MHRHHVGKRHQQRNAIERYMDQIGSEPVQEQRKGCMVECRASEREYSADWKLGGNPARLRTSAAPPIIV